jgi:hypothetical protein
MLPKIRPATGNAPGRPSIRPVKPAPPPPRPAPPQPPARRQESGFGPKGHMREPYRSHGDGATAIADYPEPPEPPTQANARPAVRQVAPMDFDDETQARPVDDHLLAQTMAPVAPIDAPYDSLPSLEVRPPFDSYEQQFVEHDPAAQLAAARDPHRDRQTVRREEPSYPVPRSDIGSGARARPVPSPWDEAQPREHGWQREASGPQQRSWNPPPETVIPQAARVPHDVRPITQPPFVMGVQPLRTQTPVYASPAPQPMQHAHAHAHAQPHYPQSGPQLPQEPLLRTHAMMPTGPALYRAPAPGQPSPSSRSTEVEAPDAAAKAGRFAWFVFGAAFGIAFAFFATGFAPRLGAKEPEPLFPPAASLPAATAPAATTAPAVVVPPPPPAAVTAPPIVAAPPPTMTVASPTALPQAPPVAPTAQAYAPPPAPAPAAAAPPAPQVQTRAPAPPVTAQAPAPPPRRNWSPPPSPPRRPAASEPTGPKPLLPCGGTEPAAAPDLNDILSGALKP